MSENIGPRKLYVGHLDADVNEDLLRALFANVEPVRVSKVIRNPYGDPYAFVEFDCHADAVAALNATNGRMLLDKALKVNWASAPRGGGGGGNDQPTPSTDTSDHYHVFVGDLSHEVKNSALKEAFAPFGEISACLVVRDRQTLVSRGYGFVAFVRKSDAQNAIESMNGQRVGRRNVRTNWSVRKVTAPRAAAADDDSGGGGGRRAPFTFDEVYNRTGPTNSTVYCGGIVEGLTEELLKRLFSRFGEIVFVRTFRNKGYAFVKFSTKRAATIAIQAVHGTEINGHPVNCFWSKESGYPNVVAAAGGYAQRPTYYSDVNYGRRGPADYGGYAGGQYGQPTNFGGPAAYGRRYPAGYPYRPPGAVAYRLDEYRMLMEKVCLRTAMCHRA